VNRTTRIITLIVVFLHLICGNIATVNMKLGIRDFILNRLHR